MKGFTDKKGKFHPITDYKGVRKSRDQTTKTQGVKVQRKRLSGYDRWVTSAPPDPEQEALENIVSGNTNLSAEEIAKIKPSWWDDNDSLGDVFSIKIIQKKLTQEREMNEYFDEEARKHGRKARIFQDDPDAVSKLEVKLAKLEKEKAYWKGLKPVPRTYQANEPDGALRSFELPNINANIRSVKQKIELIKSRQEKNIGLERKTTFKNGRKVFYYEEVPRD